MSITVEEVISMIAAWRGQQVTFTPLTGGMTNLNYRVDVNGQPYFLRLPGERTDLLGIDRESEYHNTLITAKTGVGPQVVHFLPGSGVLVTEYIQGTPMSVKTLNAPDMLTRIAATLKRLHSGARFRNDTNHFRTIDFYRRALTANDIPLLDDIRYRLPEMTRVEAALNRNPLPSVPCSNDLTADNYIDDGEQLRLIDFEYSGNNDPCYDLADTCEELQYDASQYEAMCAAYFGEAHPALLTRMYLFAIVTNVRWTLWSFIQSKISTLEIDFWKHGLEWWGLALGKLDADDFPRWLDAV